MKSISALGKSLPPYLEGVLKEIQGLKFSLIAGGNAATLLPVAGLQYSDSLRFVVNNAAGTFTDVTSHISIVDNRAHGTITVASVLNNDNVTVNGVTYTFKDNPTYPYHVLRHPSLDNTNATRLAKAIRDYELQKQGNINLAAKVTATVLTNVVKVTSTVIGIAGNAYTLVSGSATLTVTGAGTLTNGAVDASVVSDQNTDQLLVIWTKEG